MSLVDGDVTLPLHVTEARDLGWHDDCMLQVLWIYLESLHLSLGESCHGWMLAP